MTRKELGFGAGCSCRRWCGWVNLKLGPGMITLKMSD